MKRRRERLPQRLTPRPAPQPFMLAYALSSAPALAIMASAVLSAGLLLLAELERRATRYVFDDQGLRIEHGLLRRTIRVLPYSSITEIIMIQGPLARLLNIGSILPLTPATSSLAGELEGAENVAPGELLRAARRSIVPRSLIPFMLYGVREPERVCRLILERGAGGVRT